MSGESLVLKGMGSLRQSFGFLPEVESIEQYTFPQRMIFYTDRILRYLRRPALITRKPLFVFGIGLSKTGTSSLSVALEHLGYPCAHWHYPKSILRYEEGRLQINCNKLLVGFSAYTDTPIARTFKLLDSAFPSSKFILTVREENAWFKSYQGWVGSSGKGHLTKGLSEHLRRDIYGSFIPDKEINISAFKHFNQSALEYFKDRPDKLLVMNITEGDGWEKLCPFLGEPVPNIPFPRANVSKV